MELKYQDQNLIATYLQIYLRDYYGVTVTKVVKPNKIYSDEYEVSTTTPIKITGYLTPQTYSSIAIYMLHNYPNELFPGKWILDSGEWIYTTSIYDEFIVETKSSDEQHILRKDVIIPSDREQEFIDVIVGNMSDCSINSDTITVPRRVLSYLFGEVVSPLSTPEEIVRVKNYLSNFIIYDIDKGSMQMTFKEDKQYISAQIDAYFRNGINHKYDDVFKNIIWQIQDLYIRSYNGVLSDKFKDFKATGYVDPWTECILRGGVNYA